MKKLLLPLLYMLPLAAMAQQTSVTAKKVNATDKICLRGVCITTWPSGGGGGTAWNVAGNSGLTSSNKLGTLDNIILNLISNNKTLLTVLGSDSSVRIKTRISSSDSSDQGATTAWVTLNIQKYLTSSNNSILLSSVGKVINLRINPDSFYTKTEVNNYITNVLSGSAGAWLKAGNLATDPAFDYVGTGDSTDFVVKSKATTRTIYEAAGNIRHTANTIIDSAAGGVAGNHDSYRTTWRGGDANDQTFSIYTDGFTGGPTNGAGVLESTGGITFSGPGNITSSMQTFRFLTDATMLFGGSNPYTIENSIIGNTTTNIFKLARRNAFNTSRPQYIMNATGQSVQGDSVTAPAASALFDMQSTTKGFLPPRMNTAQQNGIVSPATGLIQYNTDSAALCYYNGSAWRAMATGSGGSSTTTPNSYNIALFGQSNAVGYDTTVGGWTYGTNNRVKAFKFGSYNVANPGTDNIVTGGTYHGIRNNTLFQMGLQKAADFPTDSVFLHCYATEATGSWLYSPPTTGPGEITSSNSMLDGITAYLDTVATTGHKMDAIVIQQGESDNAFGGTNMKFWRQNIVSFCRQIAAHAAVKKGCLFIFNFPGSDATYDSLRLTIDSLYFINTKQTLIDSFKITVARHLLPTWDGAHFTNESMDALGRMDYSVWQQGYHDNAKKAHTLSYIIRTGAVSDALSTGAQKLAVGSTSDPSNTYLFKVYRDASVTNTFMALRSLSTGSAAQQSLFFDVANTATGGVSLNHYSENASAVFTFRNRQIFRDTATVFQNASSTTTLTLGDNGNVIANPTTFTGNTLFSSTTDNRYNGPLSVRYTTPILFLGNTSSTTATEAELRFTTGGSTATNGSPTGSIRGYLDATGGGLGFYYSSNLSTQTKAGHLSQVGRWAFGSTVTNPSALVTIANGSTSAAQLKLQGSVNPTTPNSGDLWHDSTSSTNNVKFSNGTTTFILAKTLTATATLDFGSTAAGAVSDLTVTVTGAADGDAVSVGVPNGSTVASGDFTAWVSAANTVTVRYANNDLTTARDPASGTFRVSVIKY